jgi:hypothetical protein
MVTFILNASLIYGVDIMHENIVLFIPKLNSRR